MPTTTTTSRPRMAAIYAPASIRAGRWYGAGDLRSYRPPCGGFVKTKGPPPSAPHPGLYALDAVNAKIRARR